MRNRPYLPDRPPRQCQQPLPGEALHIGRVDHRQTSPGEAQRKRRMEQLERGIGGGLVPRIVGDHAAKCVRREYLGRGEVTSREGALPRSARPDQHHHGVGRKEARHSPSLQRESGSSSSGPSFRTLLTAGETA